MTEYVTTFVVGESGQIGVHFGDQVRWLMAVDSQKPTHWRHASDVEHAMILALRLPTESDATVTWHPVEA